MIEDERRGRDVDHDDPDANPDNGRAARDRSGGVGGMADGPADAGGMDGADAAKDSRQDPEVTSAARPGPEKSSAHEEGAEGEEVGASSVTDDSSGTLQQLEDLHRELEAVNERHLRLAAEFDNYRKRINREREEVRRRAEADLVASLLDAVDDLQRVAAHDQEDTTADAILEGVRLVEKKVRRALESAGLESIDAEGHYFNPDSMEGIMTVPADTPEEDDVVADVFQKGYRFSGTLLRPARVQVKKYEE